MSVDSSEVLVDGPWRHRFVAANGSRFHVAETGDGPLVLLLHGFPQFWWAWRHQLPALAAAGYRVAAMDLRGYGASDKPPRGYDTMTTAADVAGVVRSLGESDAVIVGHDWGGWVAWSMPGLSPRVTRAVAVVSAAHPLLLRPYFATALVRGADERAAAAAVLSFQVPMLPERRLAHGTEVRDLLTAWGGPGYPDAATLERYERAMQVPFVAHTSLEYLRWALRSRYRRDGRRFAAGVDVPIEVPVLALAGADDRFVPAGAVERSRQWVAGPWTHEVVPGAGHFLPEEAPDTVTQALLTWLKGLDA
ncbi:alpha/beta fold hydrolase [Kineosporia sp. A_224]|uniref:alpha/beta fold hydrolase n=1 Tax=Kineosporia sp. A_224 TaxID=1962180 RepID=UPI000B4C013F|nr:alpha/beta hydrolase [Kineosporia sp. A_224]